MLLKHCALKIQSRQKIYEEKLRQLLDSKKHVIDQLMKIQVMKHID
jgi:hypothetical protein